MSDWLNGSVLGAVVGVLMLLYLIFGPALLVFWLLNRNREGG